MPAHDSRKGKRCANSESKKENGFSLAIFATVEEYFFLRPLFALPNRLELR